MPTSSTSTQRAAEAFLRAKTAKGLSPRTIETYRYRLGILSTVAPTLPVGRGGVGTIEEFLAGIGPALDTRETYYRLLRNFYRWLVSRGDIELEANPMPFIEVPRVPRKVARSLTPAELRQLLLHPHRQADHAFLYLLADTGLRLSEALSVGSNSFGGGMAVVRGKVGEREVPVSPEVEARVVRVLPWPWSSRDAAGRAVRLAFGRAGLTGKRASAHTLRHTFVRLWSGDESILIDLMGWTSPRMLSIYRPFNRRRAAEQHQRYSPLRVVDVGPGPLQGQLL